MANLCAERHDDHEQFVFKGDKCVESILDWVIDPTALKENEGEQMVIRVAHNFQGYDSYFILDEFYKQICPDEIVNGDKILGVSVVKLKFIHSMCLLANAPKGIEEWIFP